MGEAGRRNKSAGRKTRAGKARGVIDRKPAFQDLPTHVRTRLETSRPSGPAPWTLPAGGTEARTL